MYIHRVHILTLFAIQRSKPAFPARKICSFSKFRQNPHNVPKPFGSVATRSSRARFFLFFRTRSLTQGSASSDPNFRAHNRSDQCDGPHLAHHRCGSSIEGLASQIALSCSNLCIRYGRAPFFGKSPKVRFILRT